MSASGPTWSRSSFVEGDGGFGPFPGHRGSALSEEAASDVSPNVSSVAAGRESPSGPSWPWPCHQDTPAVQMPGLHCLVSAG